MVELYIHSPIRPHGVVLNYLSTGTTLPFFIFPLCGLFNDALSSSGYIASNGKLIGES
jgi:hypothetical protein